MLHKLLIFIAMLFTCETVHAEITDDWNLRYTEETYPIEMTKYNDHLVMFYTTWCGESRRTLPAWEHLSWARNQEEGLRIARVDCDADKAVCKENNIKSYPTIKFFRAVGDSDGITYYGDRSVQAFNDFIDIHRTIRKSSDF